MDINIKDLTKKQREDLQKQLEEHKEENKTVWDLKEGDEYFRMTSYGDILGSSRDNYGIDRHRLSMGNLFLTREEAENEVAKRKAIVRVNKKIDELNDGWTPGSGKYTNAKYFIRYNPRLKEYRTSRSRFISTDKCLNYIKSESAAKCLIDSMEEELNIIFNI